VELGELGDCNGVDVGDTTLAPKPVVGVRLARTVVRVSL